MVGERSDICGGVGNRVFARADFPLPTSVFRTLADLDVSNVADAVNGHGCVDPGIHLLTDRPGQFVGMAVTVSIAPGNGMMIRRAIAASRPGDVIVVNGWGNRDRSVLGGNVAIDALVHGAVGLVVDGMVRDLPELREIGLPVFARGTVHRSGSDLHGYGEVCGPIACGGAVVMPEDVVLGSEDGVLVLPRSDIAWVIDEARRVEVRKGASRELRARLDEGRAGRPGYDRVQIQRALERNGCVEYDAPWPPPWSD